MTQDKNKTITIDNKDINVEGRCITHTKYSNSIMIFGVSDTDVRKLIEHPDFSNKASDITIPIGPLNIETIGTLTYCYEVSPGTYTFAIEADWASVM